MPDNNNHTDLFDSYLRQELKGSALKAFEQRLKADMDFKAAFELHTLLSEGIKEAGRAELKQYLKTNITGSGQIRPIRKLFYAAAAVILLGACLYLALSDSADMLSERKNSIVITGEPKPEPPPAPLQQNENNDSVSPGSPGITYTAPAILADSMKREDMVLEENTEPQWAYGSESERSKDADYAAVPPADYRSDLVLPEVKLADTTMYPVFVANLTSNSYKFTNQAGNDTYKKRDKTILPRNQNNIENYNLDTNYMVFQNIKGNVSSVRKEPGKKLKKAEKKTATDDDEADPGYVVEFWKSPVNFKGYVFVNNTIQLFGLDAKQVKLLQFENKLYLRAGDEYYSLVPTETGLPYKPVADDVLTKLLSTY